MHINCVYLIEKIKNIEFTLHGNLILHLIAVVGFSSVHNMRTNEFQLREREIVYLIGFAS